MENAFVYSSAYKFFMLSEWLSKALEKADINQSELSRLLTEALGRSIDRAAVSKMLKGKRSIQAEELMAIERITGMAAPSTILVPLKGRVGAGNPMEAVESGEGEYVEAPRDSTPGTVAVEVSGESMHPAYEDGTLLYYSRNSPPHEMINRRCVVKLPDGKIFVKVLRAGSSNDLWTLQSLNSLYPDIVDVPVDWAAPIDWIKPKY